VNLKKKVFFVLLTYSREDFNVGYFRAAMGDGGFSEDVNSISTPYRFSHTCIPLQPTTFSQRDFLFIISYFFLSFFFSFLLILSFLVWISQHITHTQPTDDKNSNTIHNRETNSPRLLFCLCTFYLSACGTYSRLTDLTGLDSVNLFFFTNILSFVSMNW